jgi:PhnB protein
MPLKDEFYGDRTGSFDDLEGFRWMLAQHIEGVTPEEMTRRMNEMFASNASPDAR